VDFELSGDQSALLAGLEQLIASVGQEPPKEPVFCAYADDLDAALADGGYLDVTRESGFGLLDGALVVERLARLPRTVEAAASILIAPTLGIGLGVRPLALATRLDAPARYLPMAKVLVVLAEREAHLIEIAASEVDTVDTILAYPYGRLRRPSELHADRLGPELAETLRRRWRLTIAVEAAGLMSSALDTVLEHVKMRLAFGRPLGSFQAIQHRLAMAAETAQSTKWLALRAAHSDSELDCAVAATFAQERIPAFTYDLHQFSGAMGLTLEFPLHLWTYRLRALLGELGGSSAQARAVAVAAWPSVV
jgi:Acyl-CoA dehydrogenase, C-terminal domain